MALRIPNHDFVNGPPLSSFQLFSVMDTNPYKTGLVGSYFLGGKSADPTHNYANPDLPLLVHGNPDVSDPRFAKLSRLTGYFDTQLPTTTPQTWVVLGRQHPVAQTSQSIYLSNYIKNADGTVNGDTLMKRWRTDGASEAIFYSQISETAVDSLARTDNIAGDAFNVVGSLIVPSGTTIGTWTSSETASPDFSAKTTASRMANSRPILIGSTYVDNEFTAPASVSAVLIYNSDPGSANMRNVMNWLRNVVGVQAGIWSAPKA